MLIYSMSVSVDGFTADRDGDFQWSVPTDEQFAVHLEEVRSLGVHLCGRKLYETMLVWETDPSMRDDEPAERLRRRVDDSAEGRLQPHADQRPGQRPPRDRVAGRGGRGGARCHRQARRDRRPRSGSAGRRAWGWWTSSGCSATRSWSAAETRTCRRWPSASSLDLVETRTFANRVVHERYRRASGPVAGRPGAA